MPNVFLIFGPEKRYIGKNLNSDPNYMGSSIDLKEDISKYGLDKFKKEILAECREQDLILLEWFFIVLYDAVNRKDFYNKSYPICPVLQQKGGEFINFWSSISKVKRNYNIKTNSFCRAAFSQYKGYEWIKLNSMENREKSVKLVDRLHRKPIVMEDLEFNSICSAAIWLKERCGGRKRTLEGGIRNAAKRKGKYKGYSWRFKEDILSSG